MFGFILFFKSSFILVENKFGIVLEYIGFFLNIGMMDFKLGVIEV